MIDYKDKIKKLLALAESPVEAEAKAALLKARQLMAEHKLEMADIESARAITVRRDITAVTFNSRRDFWALRLADIIGPRYCCHPFSRRTKGLQTASIGFIGLGDDFDVCSSVYEYAVDCIHSWVADTIRQRKLSAEERKSVGYSFAYGFCEGIQSAFDEQQSQNSEEWGLVLSIPKEVLDEANQLESRAFRAPSVQKSEDAFAEGYAQGREFSMQDRLRAAK